MRAAQEQVAASKEQVAAAIQQNRTAILISDEQTAPHFIIEQATSNGGIVKNAVQIRNNGNGTALNIHVRYNDGYPGNEDIDMHHRTFRRLARDYEQACSASAFAFSAKMGMSFDEALRLYE